LGAPLALFSPSERTNYVQMTDVHSPTIEAAPPRRPMTSNLAVYRHKLVIRITHWINVLCVTFLLMSGMQIFNAHPRLYWGQYGANADHAFIEMGATQDSHGAVIGLTRIGPLTLTTTGVLGASKSEGQMTERGFPAWLTLPSYQDLATGRRWHFFLAWLFVANGLTYLVYGAISGHFRRDLAPGRDELTPRHILRDIWDHIRLKQPSGEAAKRYNTLQKFAYLAVVFLLLPAMLLTGLTMSPGMDAAMPWLLDLFGGRQSARTLHFLTANLIVLFILVHLVEVLISGVWNEMRSMITGWYVVKPGAPDEKL
jgi:thiosulfate reductase cytochrome b subunit